MKKLLVLFILIMVLTACGQTGRANEIKPLTAVEKPMFVLEKTPKTVKNYVERLNEADLLSSLRISDFEKAGIDIAVTNGVCTTSATCTFDIVLTNEKGKSVTLSLEGLLDYHYSNDGTVDTLSVLWGNLSIYNGEIVLTTLNHIYKIDVANMALQQLLPAFIDETDGEYMLVDTIKTDKGYTSVCVSVTETQLVIFDENGNTLNKYPAHNALIADYHYSDISDTYAADFHCERIASFYLDPQQTVIGFTNNQTQFNTLYKPYDAFLYAVWDLGMNKPDYYASVVTVGNEKYTIALFYREQNGYAVVRRENDVITDYFTFDAPDLHIYFTEIDQEVEYIPLDDNYSKVELINNYCGQKLSIDFDNKEVELSDMYTHDWLQSEHARTSDGKYILYYGSAYGGGDVSYYDIVLYNTQTEQYKYIDTIGGMYGGSESAGFFSNGDVYTISLDDFKIFNNDMDSEDAVFEMSKNFPLGSEPEKDIAFRHLLAARRNPDDHSFVVLYNESPYCEDYFVEGDLGFNFYNSTYKVGILDPQGKLIKSFDTGEKVLTYDFRQVDMYMKTDNTICFEVLIKGTTKQLVGEVNLDTGKYAHISGGYSEWNK